MTVSADAALLLAQQHQLQQNEAASAAGISLDDSYMKDEASSFMKEDDSAAEADASAYLKDTSDALLKDEEPSITDSASGFVSQLVSNHSFVVRCASSDHFLCEPNSGAPGLVTGGTGRACKKNFDSDSQVEEFWCKHGAFVHSHKAGLNAVPTVE